MYNVLRYTREKVAGKFLNIERIAQGEAGKDDC